MAPKRALRLKTVRQSEYAVKGATARANAVAPQPSMRRSIRRREKLRNSQSQAVNKFLARAAKLFYICSTPPRRFGRGDRGARRRAKRFRLEMAPQRLEKIESAPGNGMGS